MTNRPESFSVFVSAGWAARLSPYMPAVSAAPVRKYLRFDKKLGFMLVLLTRRILLEAHTWPVASSTGKYNASLILDSGRNAEAEPLHDVAVGKA
jgi:hypothetical protein